MCSMSVDAVVVFLLLFKVVVCRHSQAGASHFHMEKYQTCKAHALVTALFLYRPQAL